jgi:hypothetical protein
MSTPTLGVSRRRKQKASIYENYVERGILRECQLSRM